VGRLHQNLRVGRAFQPDAVDVGQAFQPDTVFSAGQRPWGCVRLESLTYINRVRLESLTYSGRVRLDR
jgi:hypothetical protein